MVNESYSATISSGHRITESGHACVAIVLDEGKHKVAFSPAGARVLARQLLEWADFAERWKQKTDAERTLTWASFMTATETWAEVATNVEACVRVDSPTDEV